MSLDIWLQSVPCKLCGLYPETLNSFNYTYNCAPMWREIYPNAKNMIDIDGMTGAESVPILNHAYEQLHIYPDKFKTMNPENGWGNYEGFKNLIWNMLEEAKLYPDLKWMTSR